MCRRTGIRHTERLPTPRQRPSSQALRLQTVISFFLCAMSDPVAHLPKTTGRPSFAIVMPLLRV